MPATRTSAPTCSSCTTTPPPRQGRIVGRLEHVASGRQFQFTSGEELLACLIKAAELQEQPGLEESES